jgi:ubiquinone/menaquinone biosynthesis C-methylase UbiE
MSTAPAAHGNRVVPGLPLRHDALMILNRFEKMLVNNPVRQAMLRGAVRTLHEAAGSPPLQRVLEVGCGEGAGLCALTEVVHPQELDGFDLDPAQVQRAQARSSQLPRAPRRLWVGDAAAIEAPAETYDAVFEFTILHHVPPWRDALAEIRRVLKPGGHFLFEELSREFFHETGPLGWTLRRTTVHPWAHMFDWPAFEGGLADAGLKLVRYEPKFVRGWHRGVAVRM